MLSGMEGDVPMTMLPLLPLHLVSAGLWLGCVLTEVLFERALLGQGREQERILARLHRRVDLWVELPALLTVLLTGTLMALRMPAAGWLLQAKIALGLLAVATNVYCIRLVLRRDRQAATGDWPAFTATDRLQHRAGAVVLLGLVGALALGLARLAG
jgi:uncharacterized membrane protein